MNLILMINKTLKTNLKKHDAPTAALYTLNSSINDIIFMLKLKRVERARFIHNCEKQQSLLMYKAFKVEQ